MSAEGETWLCLPGGFVPSKGVSAKQVVDRRLDMGLDSILAWLNCPYAHDAPPAKFAWWMGDDYLPCQAGYDLRTGVCFRLWTHGQ